MHEIRSAPLRSSRDGLWRASRPLRAKHDTEPDRVRSDSDKGLGGHRLVDTGRRAGRLAIGIHVDAGSRQERALFAHCRLEVGRTSARIPPT